MFRCDFIQIRLFQQREQINADMYQICILVAVAILEEVAWHLPICNSCFIRLANR